MNQDKRPPKRHEPNRDQALALEVIKSGDNVFLTGPAGVGKSFVIRDYLNSKALKPPVLASTGAAAVIIGGRTFHSFFGLGIMEGGKGPTIKRAAKNDRVRRRINKANELIIDEISMIHPQVFETASEICQAIRNNNLPFGGIRLILVGDFFQLPPVDRFEKKIPFIFETDLWTALSPRMLTLTRSMRTESESFVKILSKIRAGSFDQDVEEFLQSRSKPLSDDFDGSVLFGRKAEVESLNQAKLDRLPSKLFKFETEVLARSHVQTPREVLIGYSPLPEVLHLKIGALVMIRKNDLNDEFVNGTLGLIKAIKDETIELELLNGERVWLGPEDFQILDGDGKVTATIRNFPLTLGWATTIHKSQGASIDRLHVNLRALWENGQAYVALSRAKCPENLYVDEWTPGSIKADPRVVKFYRESCGPEIPPTEH